MNTEENNREPQGGAPSPEEISPADIPPALDAEEENASYFPMPEEPEEPEEIVSWYTAPEQGKEVVSYYIHTAPLPGTARNGETSAEAAPPDTGVWKRAAEKERRRRRRGLWILLGSLALIAVVVTGALLWPTLTGGRRQGGNVAPEEGDNASSIVDIFGHRETKIPRCQGDPSVRLAVSTQRGEELSAADIYVKVNPSVVTVVSEEDTGASIGTGVIMTADGYIITNAHVISGGKSCWVALNTGATLDAELVGFDETEDLAVLKAVNASDLPTAEFGNSDDLVVGEKVYAIGNPLGIELRGTLTDGIVSAVNRQLDMDNGYMTVIQTTAALNNGNSGGPLINSSGQVIGINTLKMSGSGWEGEATVEGLGFALPISTSSFVINDLIATGHFRGIPTIGVTVQTVRSDNGDSTQVVVLSVEEGMGAQEAGVQVGDVILAADGNPVVQTSDLLAIRRSHAIGETMRLTLLRDGETVEADVMLYSDRKAK